MEQKENVKLDFDVKFKLKDILRYNVSVASKNIVNNIVMAIGVFVLIFFLYKMFTSDVSIDIYLSQNIMFLLIPILIFVLIPWRVWKITVSQMQLPAFAYGVKYSFSTEGIVLDIGEAKEEMSWDLFVKVVETKHDFRFYVNQVSAQIIPKHNFTEEELNRFRTVIKNSTSVYSTK